MHFNLWNQYITMVLIMLNFIRTERIGDLELTWKPNTHAAVLLYI